MKAMGLDLVPPSSKLLKAHSFGTAAGVARSSHDLFGTWIVFSPENVGKAFGAVASPRSSPRLRNIRRAVWFYPIAKACIGIGGCAMRRNVLIPAAIALAALAPSPVLADCVDVTNGASQEAKPGIAKDGSHAPLEGSSGSQVETQSATGTTTTSADALAQSPQKDGGDVPMGEGNDLATSGQDASAQQSGGQTAAATAAQDKC
jgi:hypothetical protein